MITQRAQYLRGAAIAVVLLLLRSIAVLGGAQPAHAASRVDVSPTPSASGETVVTLSGSGFQYQPNAPGGVYVFFGAVSDPWTNAWAPSQGGKSGETFSYASTGGAQLLVAFQGGSSAEAANAMIDSSGAWRAEMKIPGSTFEATFGDPHSGSAQHGQTVDCLQVQCGIITIGAHGMINANNESFTPVSFDTGGGQLESGSGTVQDFSAGGGETQSINDEATTLDVPGSDEDAAQDEETAADAAPKQLQATDADSASSNSMLTGIVIAVLGFAVIALIVAVVLVLVKRAKTKKAAGGVAGAGGPDDGGGSGGSGDGPPGDSDGTSAAAPEDGRVPEEVGR